MWVKKKDRGKRNEEQAHADVWVWASAGVHVWVHGFDAAVVTVDIYGS